MLRKQRRSSLQALKEAYTDTELELQRNKIKSPRTILLLSTSFLLAYCCLGGIKTVASPQFNASLRQKRKQHATTRSDLNRIKPALNLETLETSFVRGQRLFLARGAGREYTAKLEEDYQPKLDLGEED